ncbi:MAG: hypothetical protein JAZ17_05565 [Candidatus Thiodiazotropha endolucinida]|nr:hypothetical protein [Candidatus Thiodiazotropha endolucinida]
MRKFVCLLVLLLLVPVSDVLASDTEETLERFTRMENELDKKAKSQCYAAVPSNTLCKCINSKLGWGVSFRDYVIIRTLDTDEQRFQYIQRAFSQGSPLSQERLMLILGQVNEAWEQCRQ